MSVHIYAGKKFADAMSKAKEASDTYRVYSEQVIEAIKTAKASDNEVIKAVKPLMEKLDQFQDTYGELRQQN